MDQYNAAVAWWDRSQQRELAEDYPLPPLAADLIAAREHNPNFDRDFFLSQIHPDVTPKDLSEESRWYVMLVWNQIACIGEDNSVFENVGVSIYEQRAAFLSDYLIKDESAQEETMEFFQRNLKLLHVISPWWRAARYNPQLFETLSAAEKFIVDGKLLRENDLRFMPVPVKADRPSDMGAIFAETGHFCERVKIPDSQTFYLLGDSFWYTSHGNIKWSDDLSNELERAVGCSYARILTSAVAGAKLPNLINQANVVLVGLKSGLRSNVPDAIVVAWMCNDFFGKKKKFTGQQPETATQYSSLLEILRTIQSYGVRVLLIVGGDAKFWKITEASAYNRLVLEQVSLGQQSGVPTCTGADWLTKRIGEEAFDADDPWHFASRASKRCRLAVIALLKAMYAQIPPKIAGMLNLYRSYNNKIARQNEAIARLEGDTTQLAIVRNSGVSTQTWGLYELLTPWLPRSCSLINFPNPNLRHHPHRSNVLQNSGERKRWRTDACARLAAVTPSSAEQAQLLYFPNRGDITDAEKIAANKSVEEADTAKEETKRKAVLRGNGEMESDDDENAPVMVVPSYMLSYDGDELYYCPDCHRCAVPCYIDTCRECSARRVLSVKRLVELRTQPYLETSPHTPSTNDEVFSLSLFKDRQAHPNDRHLIEDGGRTTLARGVILERAKYGFYEEDEKIRCAVTKDQVPDYMPDTLRLAASMFHDVEQICLLASALSKPHPNWRTIGGLLQRKWNYVDDRPNMVSAQPKPITLALYNTRKRYEEHLDLDGPDDTIDQFGVMAKTTHRDCVDLVTSVDQRQIRTVERALEDLILQEDRLFETVATRVIDAAHRPIDDGDPRVRTSARKTLAKLMESLSIDMIVYIATVADEYRRMDLHSSRGRDGLPVDLYGNLRRQLHVQNKIRVSRYRFGDSRSMIRKLLEMPVTQPEPNELADGPTPVLPEPATSTLR